MSDKPPLGIVPQGMHDLQVNQMRALALLDAIKRYLVANEPIPREWVEEFTRRALMKGQ